MAGADEARSQPPHALLGAAVHAVQEGVLGLDFSGRVTYANPAALRLLGYSADELMGQHEHELLHRQRADGGAYPPERCPIQATLLDGGIHHAYGESFRKRDGAPLPVEFTSAPLHEQGRLVGAAVVFADARDRTRAEDAERRARQKLVALYESITEAFIALDREWRIVYLNPAAQSSAPGQRSDAVGRSLWEVAPEILGSRFETEYRHAMRDNVRVTFEAEGVGPWAGRWFDVTATPTEDGLSILYRDVTDRKRSEAEQRTGAIERPIARRIVQDIVETGAISHQILTQVGRNLAATGTSGTLEGSVQAFADMGLGRLALERAEGQRYVFQGSDLLERRPGSRVATCSFTLGYLSEAVSRVHQNEPTLGTEIECQSRGAKECRFVVQVKKPEEGLARRVKELV